MGPAGHIEKYYSKRIESINGILQKSPEKITEEDYHDLRVDIKKLKALMALLNFCARSFNKKTLFHPFVPIFRQAGKIRELQLEIGTLKEFNLYDALTRYRLTLERQLRIEKRKFNDLNGPWMKEGISGSIHSLSHFFVKASHSEIEEFLEKQKSGLHRLLLVRTLDEDEIHLLRKKIKEYYYTARIFSPDNEQFEKIDRFQLLLGDWHDTVIMQQRLHKAMDSGELQLAESQRVNNLISTLASKQRQFYKKLHAEKDDIIHLRFVDLQTH